MSWTDAPPARRARARASRGPRVEVRVGSRGRTLRIDGTFASYYEPGLPITGSVWDALAAPLLLLPPPRRRRILVLGLGGGSAARVLRALAPRARIAGVERSGDVVRVARRWLDLDALEVEVIRADAHRFLAQTRRRFDFIVEDIFVGRGRAVHKPEWLPRPGLALAARRLTPGGLLVSNTIDETRAVSRELRSLFPAAVHVEVEDFDNGVLVAGPRPVSAAALRAAVRAHPVLRATAPRLRMRGLR